MTWRIMLRSLKKDAGYAAHVIGIAGRESFSSSVPAL
jgi:hypothetical protein